MNHFYRNLAIIVVAGLIGLLSYIFVSQNIGSLSFDFFRSDASSNFSITAVRGNNVPVITKNGYDYAPTIMREGNVYKMWWCGGTPWGDAIHYSESSNLEGPWSTPVSVFSGEHNSSTKIMFDEIQACDPSIVKIGSTYYMYYGGNDEIAGNEYYETNIGLATSNDGINWSRANEGEPIIKAEHIPSPGEPRYAFGYGAGQPSAIYIDGKVYLLFTDDTGKTNNHGIYIIRSSDPTFQSNAEELVGPNTWATKTPQNHTSYSLHPGSSQDWKYIPSLNAFVIANHWQQNSKQFIFKKFELTADPSGEIARLDTSVDNYWYDGPGIVGDQYGHITNGVSCGSLTIDSLQAIHPNKTNPSTNERTVFISDIGYTGVDFSTGGGGANLTAPISGSTIATNNNDMQFSWQAVPGMTHYIVDFSLDPSFSTYWNNGPVGTQNTTINYSNITQGANDNTNEVPTLVSGTTYYWRVYSYVPGVSSCTSNTSNFSVTRSAPSVISISTPACSISYGALNPDDITINFTGSPDPNFGFTVDVSVDSNFATQYVKTISQQSSSISTNMTGFTGPWPNGTQPFSPQAVTMYYLRAYNGSHGNVSSFSVPLCVSGLPGDIDSDGDVDIFDYNILVTNFGLTGSGIQGDIDNDGDVDIFDYNTVVSNFGLRS